MAQVEEAGEQQALNTYLEFLKNQGMTTHQLTKCKHFLRYLTAGLRGSAGDGDAYRRAADRTLSNFPAEPMFVEAVREFYYYWSGVKKPEAGQQRVAAPPRHEAALPLPLAELLRNVNEDYWFKPELSKLERQWRHLKALHDYSLQLRVKGCDDVSIEARVHAVKPLLYVLRDAEQTPDSFRNAVDGVLLMLPRTERWAAFAGLAREFYYFWAHLPDAGQHLQLQIKTSDIREIYSP